VVPSELARGVTSISVVTAQENRQDGGVMEGTNDPRAAAPGLPDRDAFDLAGVAYFNCAYMGPLPRLAVEAGRRGLERKARPWEIGVSDFFEPLERVRLLFAHLVGGDADGVCIVPSVSYGIALAAANLRVGRGETIVVLSEQFPSNVYVWHDVAARNDARVVTVPRPADDDWTVALEQAIDERCAVVAIPPCHWTDGTAVDLVRVGDHARSIGAALVVDACQAAGAIPLDVGQIQPDFLVSAAYKWLLGPYSVGFCWMAPNRREGRPLEQNWITRSGSDDFAGLVNYCDDYSPGARRYDMGEVSNFALLPVAIASMELLAGWGVDAVAAHAQTLTSAIARGASDLGFGVAAPAARSPHLLGLRLPRDSTPRSWPPIYGNSGCTFQFVAVRCGFPAMCSTPPTTSSACSMSLVSSPTNALPSADKQPDMKLAHYCQRSYGSISFDDTGRRRGPHGRAIVGD
jgi:selenocysteine lyase/cysteine desulfurase